MPSIPQSLLWISLVVLWLFVLVPMLVSKRDAVRRTSDVALATRVLTSGTSARLLKRGGPAAGHRSDPDWQRSASEFDDADEVDAVDDVDAVDEDEPARSGSRVFVAAAGEQGELDYPDVLDVEVVADDSELPLSEAGLAAEVEAQERAQAQAQARAEAEARAQAEAEAQAQAEAAEAEAEDVAEADGYEYEYVEDSSGLEAEADSPAPAARPRRLDTQTAAAVSARKYEFRKRVLMSLAVILVFSAITAFTVAPSTWWICGGAAVATVLYLAYLRRQTRIEQQVRARRARRAQRPRARRESVGAEAFEVVPSRLRRPGVAVLEIDDEDPVFEHLEYAATAREYDWRGDLPRASGQ